MTIPATCPESSKSYLWGKLGEVGL